MGRLFRIMLAVGLLAALIGSSASNAASGRTGLPIRHPSIAGTMVACFDKKEHDYVGKVEPWHCDFAGRVEFAGVLQGKSTKNEGSGSFARVPVEGVFERIEWENDWGNFKSYGDLAVNGRTGAEVTPVVWRRIRCPDGSTWYSKASILDTENGYDIVIRLPVCGEAEPVGAASAGGRRGGK
jgi:hypothetical protein